MRNMYKQKYGRPGQAKRSPGYEFWLQIQFRVRTNPCQHQGIVAILLMGRLLVVFAINKHQIIEHVAITKSDPVPRQAVILVPLFQRQIKQQAPQHKSQFFP